MPMSARHFRLAPPLLFAATCVAVVLLRQPGGYLGGAAPRDDAAVGAASAAGIAQETSEARAPSPMALAAEYVTLDITYMRWLWWPIILYLFWGMAYVCDVYFVRTIDVISERFNIPDDVAGATLMALGCNGPEMALNTISIFHPSNIGVGAVIGGEVFNVLVIIGTAVLATPKEYLPLKLVKFNFFRDVIFYVVSVAVLYWVLKDGIVTRLQALLLLCGAVTYTTVVVFSGRLAEALSRCRSLRMTRTNSRRMSKRVTRRISWLRKISGDTLGDDDEDEEENEPEPDPAMVREWVKAVHSKEPSQGSVLGVRVDVRNRLMDRNHRSEERYVWLCEDALYVSTALDPTEGRQQLRRASTGFVYERRAMSKQQRHWHHGGLVNQPILVDKEAKDAELTSASTLDAMSKPLLNEPSRRKVTLGTRPPALDLPGFKEAPLEVIPLEDVLYCEAPGDQKHFALHVHQHDSDLGSLMTLEFNTKDPAVLDVWVGSIRTALAEQRRRTADAPPSKSFFALLMEWAEWLQFPVKFWLRMTIPDMDDPKLQHWYPVSFFMSMTWLAIFAYSVVAACDGIHDDFGISVTVLGFTVAAAGTSFPNVFSGMVVARQGKTSMAIANALGANVQNVFLALAVPWTIQTCLINGGPFTLVVNDLLPAVIECFITLLPVVLVFQCSGDSMPGWSGGLFLFTYAVYLIIALGQQTTNCVTWPFPCTGGA